MGKRGPKAGMGGRPTKPLVDKIMDGNPGKRLLKVVEFRSNEIAELPEPPEFLIEVTKTTEKWPTATDIYTKTVAWVSKTGCLKLIPTDYIEEYSLCKARWLECEQVNARLGLLAKHPTTGQPMQSPYVQMAMTYLRQSDVAWSKIYEVVKINCSTEFRQNGTPHDDIMERLLSSRRGG